MPVTAQIPYEAHNADGLTAQFAFPFRIFGDSQILVMVQGVAKFLITDYLVTGAGNAGGGSITFNAGRLPPAGALVELKRNLAPIRETNYLLTDAFRKEIVENDQDYQSMLLQDLLYWMSIGLNIPGQAADRANKHPAFDAAGQPILAGSAYTVVVQQGTSPSPTLTLADAAAGIVFIELPESGEVVVGKTDDSENVVRIVPKLVGQTVCRDTYLDLTIQDEVARLVLNGTNWYRIG
jgi:hypothetical protein